MSIILFDTENRKSLFPLTLTKATSSLRLGIVTIEERWTLLTQQKVFVYTEKYLQHLYLPFAEGDHIWIDANVVPNNELADRILSLQLGEAISDTDGLIAGRSDKISTTFNTQQSLQWFDNIYENVVVKRLQLPQQIFQWNDEMIRFDFEFLTKGRTSQPISHTNQVFTTNNIFIEEGASIEFCTLNSTTGPIYIGKDATVMEGTMLRGPFAFGENSLLKMGSKIYGATTIGPNCVAGGEIKNVVMQANSNKAHDGYLGDSVVGEWCNFGAGSSNSNVKNTGGTVKLWNYAVNDYIDAGQKCGVIMGDYSRVAINSRINTGSVIGVCCNVFGSGLLPKVTGNFDWTNEEKYEFNKALKDISNWKQMKHQVLFHVEVAVLKHIFETS